MSVCGKIRRLTTFAVPRKVSSSNYVVGAMYIEPEENSDGASAQDLRLLGIKCPVHYIEPQYGEHGDLILVYVRVSFDSETHLSMLQIGDYVSCKTSGATAKDDNHVLIADEFDYVVIDYVGQQDGQQHTGGVPFVIDGEVTEFLRSINECLASGKLGEAPHHLPKALEVHAESKLFEDLLECLQYSRGTAWPRRILRTLQECASKLDTDKWDPAKSAACALIADFG
jgi:hypothetical protein